MSLQLQVQCLSPNHHFSFLINVNAPLGFYNGSNYAYLTYASADSASQAIRYEHNTLWIDKFISVEYARALPSPLGASSAGLQQQW